MIFLADSPHLYTVLGNTIVLVITQGQVQVLHRLGRSAFQQVIQRSSDDDSLSAAVNLDTSDSPSVVVGCLDDIRNCLLDLDEFFLGVFIFVELPDVGGGERFRERSRENGDDSREPRPNRRNEGDVHW